MRVWWCAVLAACGRVGFDPLTGTDPLTDAGGDATALRPCLMPVGHDDDGDGVDDACDGCPHLADAAQLDRDGDEVDDVCDPHPDALGDHIAYFDPFLIARPEWALDAGIVYGTDQLLIDARSVAILHANLTLGPGRDVLAIRGHIGAVAAGQRQVNVRMRAANMFFFSSMRDPGTGATSFALAYTLDNSTFTVLDSMPLPGPLANGDFVLGLVENPPGATTFETWAGTELSVMGTPPAQIVPDHLDIAVIGADVQLDCFVRIHTD